MIVRVDAGKGQVREKRQSPPKVKKVPLSKTIHSGVILVLSCFVVPILYMQVISMMYGLRNTPIADIFTKNSALWRDVVVNSVLAVLLTVKIA